MTNSASMSLRPHQRSKDGKDHTYWSLVETVRTANGARQRTLCYLWVERIGPGTKSMLHQLGLSPPQRLKSLSKCVVQTRRSPELILRGLGSFPTVP